MIHLLLAGVPQLISPGQTESHRAARCIEVLGSSLTLEAPHTRDTISHAVIKLAEGEACRPAWLQMTPRLWRESSGKASERIVEEAIIYSDCGAATTFREGY
jgi:UDP:flavonoid glycosyltransferase YjiC (YdhE family)